MSYADKVFKEMCTNIIQNGIDTTGELVRPKWEDGTYAYTKKIFGVVNRYDLRKEFPVTTLRRTAIRSAMDEILWIYQKKSNNIKDLNSHVWDEWADEEGTIGFAYGYQIGKTYLHHMIDDRDEEAIRDLSNYPSFKDQSSYHQDHRLSVYLDQIDGVLYDLKHTPFSRRIMTNMYNFDDLYAMHLYPCAYSCTFNVTKNENDKLVLNLLLNQRSQDVLAAGNWNDVQYALLLMMIAQSVDMIPGELIHVISDCHIYDRHIDIVKELITREEYPAPKVWLNPEVKNFYDFTTNDLHVENYKYGEQIKNIPIAV